MKFTFKITETTHAYVDVHGDSYHEAETELNRMYASGELNIDKHGSHESDTRLICVES